MKDWKKIQSEIRDALSGHDAKVEYHAKCGSGWNARCSFFTVTLGDDWDWDAIQSAINKVCDDWDLTIDDDSADGDFDLNATWDIDN